MLKSILTFAAVAMALALVVPRLAPNLSASSARTAVTTGAPPASMPPRRGPNGSSAYVRSDRRGQFVSNIEINGRTFQALVDTGATSVALRYEDARDLGLLRQERFDRNISTANGIGRGMMVRLNNVRIGDVIVYDVEAMVLQPGALTTNLLGMSFLRRLSRFEVKSDVVVLEQ
jgi:aspartyl protease family protein